MNAADLRLPPGFEALEPFVQRWAVTGAAARAQLRCESSEAERASFYTAALPLLAPALDRLDQKPIPDFDAAEKRLMNLMLSLAIVALAVEIQRDAEPDHAQSARHMRITRAPSDVHC